ncbi:MAG: DUF512 domain-containing protein [Candidatus Cloacimonetes bacterium]|nr:DUF512 domain-containing protein [Candidatus Cloacimonadota bacterium]
MPLKIASVNKDGLAVKYGLRVGDTIISINNQSVEDFLDLQFHSAEEVLSINFKDNSGDLKQAEIHQNWETPLGIEPVVHKCRTCTNDCIFCFVDQIPTGLRKTLYIKDDDYRLSFTFGNYITLTNLSPKDYDRIIHQKLSPLYISVHTTNPLLHKRMFRYKQNFNIMEKLKFLSDNRIELHTQIVIVPGWNDGNELESSLKDLISPDLNILSIGIVPVGITKYRKSLTKISKVSSELAEQLLEISQKYPRTYCSDEIYLLADRELPNQVFYNYYPQLENGIGMLRLFSANWKKNKEKFISEIKKNDKKLVFVTGKLAFNFISEIASEMNQVYPDKIRVFPVINKFFGKTVTVTGLLTASDILHQLSVEKNETVVISSNVFNDDGYTLDNVHKKKLKYKLKTNLLIVDEEFFNWEFVN